MQKILVIDDDENLRDTIGIMLEQSHFLPILAADGKSGMEKALTQKPQLIVVDLKLPDISGVDVCRQLRADGLDTPMIVLSAIGDELNKVLLLEIGADDYIVKPFSAGEFTARIRALLRRTNPNNKVLRFGDVEIDVERRNTTRGGQPVKLTPAEYKLLVYFLQNPDRALTRDLILNSVWGYDAYPNSRTVDAHVVRLRQKFEPDVNVPRHFLTVHGVGYRFLP